MTKNGEKLSEMLEFSFYISTSQKSPEVVLLGDDICFQQLAKEISSKFNLVRKGLIVNCSFVE